MSICYSKYKMCYYYYLFVITKGEGAKSNPSSNYLLSLDPDIAKRGKVSS